MNGGENYSVFDLKQLLRGFDHPIPYRSVTFFTGFVSTAVRH